MITLVLDVSTNRVIFFSEKDNYSPKTTDKTVVLQITGSLPEGMTLENCWDWAYESATRSLKHKPGNMLSPAEAAQQLLVNNRKAIADILAQKISALRAPLNSDTLMGTDTRAAKLEEARGWQLKDTAPEGFPTSDVRTSYPLLSAVAEARGLTMDQAAALIISKDRDLKRVLRQTEIQKEAFSGRIAAATSSEQLITIRDDIQKL